MNLIQRLHNHPASAARTLIGTSGFTLPKLRDPLFVEVDAQGIQVLQARGIKVLGEPGQGNFVAIEGDQAPHTVNLTFTGHAANNLLILQNCFALTANLSFQNDGNVITVCKGWYKLRIDMAGSRCVCFVGANASTGDARCTVYGEERSLLIGDDSMLSWAVDLRTGEAHALIDLATRTVTNLPEDIVIGPHVWVGHDVLISKGVEIGAGAIIGARSVVTRPVPARCAAAGAPARVVRENVSWTRPALPDRAHIDALLNRDYMSTPRPEINESNA